MILCKDCTFFGIDAHCNRHFQNVKKDMSCINAKKKLDEKSELLIKAVNTTFEHIAEFHDKINHPNPKKPNFFKRGFASPFYSDVLERVSESMKGVCKDLDSERINLRASWIVEEVSEFLAAKTEEDQVDALCDMLVFIFGTFGEMGYKPGVAFEAVHRANMKKNPAVNGEKVTKPKGWTGPEKEIKADIERQKEEHS